MKFLRMTDLDLAEKRVMIRLDLNVPIEDGRITSDARLRAALPSIEQAMQANARVMLLSHLGRPEEGVFDTPHSLAPISAWLSRELDITVKLKQDWLDGVNIEPGQVVLCENVRFNPGEKADDETLAKKMAGLCDVFVMDAFGAAHRAQASTHGVAEYAPVACAGPLLTAELEALSKALEDPKRPLVAIVGGSKVSTKLTVLESLSNVVDYLIVGGGIANTFIKASGYEIGKSLCEDDLLDTAKSLMEKMKARGADIPIPEDVTVGKEFSPHAEATYKRLADVQSDDMIFDVGPYGVQGMREIIKQAGTIVWNGPLGVFEFDQFADGTRALSRSMAATEAFTLAGGGDTLAAIDKFGIGKKIDYISTGGGAFLEFLEGKTLPAVAVLERRASE